MSFNHTEFYLLIREKDRITHAEQCDFLHYHDGIVGICIGNKVGYIDKKGNIIIPPGFDDGNPFFCGLAAVCVDDKWGYINKKGHFVIEPKYSKADDFLYGMAHVTLDGKLGFINRWEMLKRTFWLSEYGERENQRCRNRLWNSFTENKTKLIQSGLEILRSESKVGVIDKYTGKIIIPQKFDYINSLVIEGNLVGFEAITIIPEGRNEEFAEYYEERWNWY